MAGSPESQFNFQPQEYDARRIQSECALFGVYYQGEHDIRSELYRGGTALQHRAEGAAGGYLSNGKEMDIVRDFGTLAVAFRQGRNLPQVDSPRLGILHTRYPTSGGSEHRPNIQPMMLDGIVMGHHGNLTNARELMEKFGPIKMGGEFPDHDSWVALNVVAKSPGNTLGEKLINAQKHFEGGWALILSDGKKMYAARDPHGIRPLSIGHVNSGEKPEGYMVSVESSAFSELGVKDFWEIQPGETIEIDDSGVKTIDISPKAQKSCIFEFVYMMRPDSIFMGEQVYKARRRAGEILWREHPVDPGDENLYVMPIPDSGRPSALGYYQAAMKDLGDQVVYEEGLVSNRYVGRMFIKPTLERARRSKFYGIEHLIENRIIAVCDDSNVRGDTAKEYARIFRENGAKEAHCREASPEIKHPCFYGVAVPTNEELIANRIPNINERARFLGLDSLGHLSMAGLFESVGVKPDEMAAALGGESRYCTHCFDGNGPYNMHANETIVLRE